MGALRIGVVGATGAVGQEIIQLLEKRFFPVLELRCFASMKSAGSTLSFRDSKIVIEALGPSSFKGLDLVFFSAGSSISKQWAPVALKDDAIVVDNSSAFRKDPNVPLIIPEVNAHALKTNQGLIANPNCATILLLMALAPLHRLAKLKRVVVSTYQAASGAGAKAMQDLEQETHAFLTNRPYTRSVVPFPYAFNLFLHNSALHDNGYVEEELKMLIETRKILEDDSIRLTATCVRVPVLRSHSESVNAEFHFPIDPSRAYEILQKTPGLSILEDRVCNRFPMPIDATGQYDVFCGRIRKDLSQDNALDLWIVGDQLLKGAALNAVQIAEILLHDALDTSRKKTLL
jgi:aspartate-semialdehyde dehydrogenase